MANANRLSWDCREGLEIKFPQNDSLQTFRMEFYRGLLESALQCNVSRGQPLGQLLAIVHFDLNCLFPYFDCENCLMNCWRSPSDFRLTSCSEMLCSSRTTVLLPRFAKREVMKSSSARAELSDSFQWEQRVAFLCCILRL